MPIVELPQDAPIPHVVRYAYRSFDRQWIIADTRLGDFYAPDLWRAHGERQVYLTSLYSQALGLGPALTSSSHLPDLDHFRGSYGAKAVIPLYRTADASQTNITPGLLEILGRAYQRDVTPKDFLAYLYGVLAQPAFTARFETELETRELRLPITKDTALFEKVRKAGEQLLWFHTYGERFVPVKQTRVRVPPKAAKCVKAVPATLTLTPKPLISTTRHGRFASEKGSSHRSHRRCTSSRSPPQGRSVLAQVPNEEWGRQESSPLDDIRPKRWTSEFTTELLDLLWVLEATLKCYPEQSRLLEAVVASDCFRADELPRVPEVMRKPPKTQTINSGLFDTEYGL